VLQSHGRVDAGVLTCAKLRRVGLGVAKIYLKEMSQEIKSCAYPRPGSRQR